MSRDRTAWFASYSAPVGDESVAGHMKTLAFADEEVITFLQGERNWISVSGVKGNRIFYRKAIIACAGKTWHHIAFEYPADQKQRMEPFVIRAAEFAHHSENEGCDEAVSSARQ